jgi:quercetin dioxygenase-like cupin family protein
MAPHPQLTDEIADSAAQYALGLLPDSERSSLEQHLAEGCLICESEIGRCADLLASWAKQEASLSAPLELRQRLLQNLGEKPNLPVAPSSPILFNRSGIMLLRTTAMEWGPGPTPGLQVKVLFDDPRSEMTTVLIRMSPGALYPSHRHKGVEEVYVLEGELLVEGMKLCAGDFCLSQPESVHQSTYSGSGCLLVVKTSKHDEVLP